MGLAVAGLAMPRPALLVLPDGYGTYGIGFQVRDAAGNASPTQYAGSVERLAAVGLALVQVDNNGNVRSCGSSESAACSSVVKKFRTTITAAASPPADLLFRAWRRINGVWTETTASPYMREAIGGRTSITMTVTATLAAGLWRFQTSVPRAQVPRSSVLPHSST